MVDILKKFLLDFFPNVLNNIIVEYITFIEHEFELTKYVRSMFDYKYYSRISDNIMYTYENNILTSKIIDNNILHEVLFASDHMCVYKNNIYVAFDENIYVFDEKCNKIRTINKYIDNSNISICEDKIFISNNGSKLISITDLHGTFIDYIQLTDEVYISKVYNNNIYFLTYDEILYECNHNGDILKIYDCSTIFNSKSNK